MANGRDPLEGMSLGGRLPRRASPRAGYLWWVRRGTHAACLEAIEFSFSLFCDGILIDLELRFIGEECLPLGATVALTLLLEPP